MSDDNQTTEKSIAAVRAAILAEIQRQADGIYWWDGADKELLDGGPVAFDPWIRADGKTVDLADKFDMDAIAAAALKAGLVSEWHDIATAPRDGALVLLWVGHLPLVGRWFADNVASFGWDEPGWGVVSAIDKELGSRRPDLNWQGYGVGIEPTHWMPLPEPPR